MASGCIFHQTASYAVLCRQAVMPEAILEAVDTRNGRVIYHKECPKTPDKRAQEVLTPDEMLQLRDDVGLSKTEPIELIHIEDDSTSIAGGDSQQNMPQSVPQNVPQEVQRSPSLARGDSQRTTLGDALSVYQDIESCSKSASPDWGSVGADDATSIAGRSSLQSPEKEQDLRSLKMKKL